MAEIVKYFHIKQTFTSGYTPHSSGRAERQVQNVANALRTVVNKAGTDWDIHLPAVTWALNTSVCSVHGHTPHFLLFGRNPFFPYEHTITDTSLQSASRSQILGQILLNQQIAHQIASDRAKESEATMKNYFDKHRKDSKIVPGSIVYIYTPRVQGEHARKFSPYFTGPYVCVERLPRDKVTLKCMTTNTMYKSPIHISRLKLASNFDPKMTQRQT